MKPLNSKEVRELAIAEKTACLQAANKDSARKFLLEMMASLPRTPLPAAKIYSDLKDDLHRTILEAGARFR